MANEYTYTVQTDKGSKEIEGVSYSVTHSGALEVSSDEGNVATFAAGRWVSVEAEKAEKARERKATRKAELDAQALTGDQRKVQERAEMSERGENPTLGEPDIRAINGEIETGEDEKSGRNTRGKK